MELNDQIIIGAVVVFIMLLIAIPALEQLGLLLKIIQDDIIPGIVNILIFAAVIIGGGIVLGLLVRSE